MGDIYITKISTTLYRIQVGFTPYDSAASLEEAIDTARDFDKEFAILIDGETQTRIAIKQ